MCPGGVTPSQTDLSSARRVMHYLFRYAPIPVLALTLAACDKLLGVNQIPTSLTGVSAESTRVVVGGTTTVGARLLDQNRDPIGGHPVRFRVTEGGGSVSAGEVHTDADGRASTEWTLGVEAGTNRLEVLIAPVDEAADTLDVEVLPSPLPQPQHRRTLHQRAGSAV